MPSYQLILFAKPETSPEKLASLFQNIARVVYRETGVFRTVQNYGVRPLAYPIKKTGNKYEEVRWIEAVYDCSPPVLPIVGAVIQADKDVLQYKHLVNTDPLGRFTGTAKKEKLKKLPGGITSEVFDVETLQLKPVVQGLGATPSEMK